MRIIRFETSLPGWRLRSGEAFYEIERWALVEDEGKTRFWPVPYGEFPFDPATVELFPPETS